MGLWIDDDVLARVDRMGLAFNRYGLDPYGVSREHLGVLYTALRRMYRHWLTVTAAGLERVPDAGPALLIGNHSGGIPMDAGMVLAAVGLEKEPPRFVHAMVEYFAQKWPFVSPWFSRVGQLAGLPEHAERLLREGRIVMAFPEGVRGTGKLWPDRYKLMRFGTGFVRLALATGVPIVPFAFIGGEEAVPTVLRLERLARLVGAPYIPVPLQVLPVPMPVSCQIYFGEPVRFGGDGRESDEVVAAHVDDVRARIAALIEHGLAQRPRPFNFLTRLEVQPP